MTLRIETTREGQREVFRLIGRVQVKNVGDLEGHIAGGGRSVVLDLDEVTLVDVEVVRFLNDVERTGIELRHCPRFIRTWMERERDLNDRAP